MTVVTDTAWVGDIVGGMAPQHSIADDVAELSRALGQLARVAMAGRSLSQLERAAPSAGLSAEQARAYWRGEILLPPAQTVSLVNAVLEQARMSQVSYLAQLKLGHAGSDVYGETLTVEAVDAALLELAGEFGGWKVSLDGYESLGTDKPKLTWVARRAAEPSWPDVAAVTHYELQHKLGLIEASIEADRKNIAAYMNGGTTRRPFAKSTKAE